MTTLISFIYDVFSASDVYITRDWGIAEEG